MSALPAALPRRNSWPVTFMAIMPRFLALAVDVYEVQVIGLQASEAAFEAPEEGVARAIGNFCGQPDVVAARGHDLADTALALAVAISVSSVEVCDTEFDRMIQRSKGF